MDYNSVTGYESYFSLIDPDYLRELDSVTADPDLRIDFRVAYLILFFHLSQREEAVRAILLGDLFISILTRRLIKRDRYLLTHLIEKISACHSENMIWRVKAYKFELLNLLREVSHDDDTI